MSLEKNKKREAKKIQNRRQQIWKYLSYSSQHENNLFDFERKHCEVIEFSTATKTHALNMCYKFNGTKHFWKRDTTSVYFVLIIVINWVDHPKCAVIVAMSLVKKIYVEERVENWNPVHYFTKLKHMFILVQCTNNAPL